MIDFCSVMYWNILFYFVEVFFALAAIFGKTNPASRVAMWIAIVIIYFRIMELIAAFFGDAFEKPINFYDPGLPILQSERIVLLIFAYFEIIFSFSVVYSLLAATLQCDVLKNANGFFDTLFFSAITITTTGYGDIYPITWQSKLFAVMEVLAGIVFIAMSLSGYLSRKDKNIIRDHQPLSGCFKRKQKPITLTANEKGQIIVKPD